MPQRTLLGIVYHYLKYHTVSPEFRKEGRKATCAFILNCSENNDVTGNFNLLIINFLYITNGERDRISSKSKM